MKLYIESGKTSVKYGKTSVTKKPFRLESVERCVREPVVELQIGQALIG